MTREGRVGVVLMVASLGVIGFQLSCGRPATQEAGIPKNDYNILIHYDLGMHCTGFDFSYCCVLPPYNSVLAQVVRTARAAGQLPSLLSNEDLETEGLRLWYQHEDNTYSEGNKMNYWSVPYRVSEAGPFLRPNDSLANAWFSALFTYGEAPLGFKPEGATQRLYVGKDITIPVDHGPTGKPVSDGFLDYTGDTGTIVYTMLNDGRSEVPIALTQRGYWEALGLPLTPFSDSGSRGSLRGRDETSIRPYQKAIVSLVRDANGSPQPIQGSNGAPATFFGTNPIDAPACEKCHGTAKANGTEFGLWKKEYDFWRNTFSDTTDYFAKVKAAAISMLEIHDKRQGTNFLAGYNPDDKTGSLTSRLGRQSVMCQECHADNIIGRLRSAPNPRTSRPTSALTKAIHLNHNRETPQPDQFGRTANCQTCHPAHTQTGSMDKFPLSEDGEFRGGDIRDNWGGCFVGRDVHSNALSSQDIQTRTHLNAVGQWLMDNVATNGKGIYCTNCHNLGSRLLYKADQLTDAIGQAGTTLRNRSMDEIVAAFRTMEGGKYASYSAEDFFDPKIAPNDRVSDYWTDSASAPYNQVDDGGDHWLAAGEPHCADCHRSPFVEGIGGTYFPVDQEGKYALMRYSKGHAPSAGHAGISCQSCHESTHGSYPVNPQGPDPVSYAQAAQYNPDGSHGPLKCGSCHAVDGEGVPTVVTNDQLAAFPDAEFPSRYEKAVAFAHARRITTEATVAGR